MIISRTILDKDTGVCVLTAEGAPTNVDAPIGSLYVRRDGGPSTTLYGKIGTGTGDWEAFETSTAGIDWNSVSGKPAGLVSSSLQAVDWTVLSSSFAQTAVSASWAPGSSGSVNWGSIVGTPSGLVSSSVQVILQNTTGNLSGSRIIGIVPSSSYAVTASYAQNAVAVDWANLTSKPAGLVSSSVQISYPDISNIPSGIVSSSTQVNYNDIQNKPTTIASASVAVSASFTVSASRAEMAGSSTSASYALSSSFATQATQAVSSSYAVSASLTTRAEEFFGRAIFPEGLYVEEEIRAFYLSSSGANISGPLTASAIFADSITVTTFISDAETLSVATASFGQITVNSFISSSTLSVISASIGALSGSTAQLVSISTGNISATSASFGQLSPVPFISASIGNISAINSTTFSASIADIQTVSSSIAVIQTSSIAVANITTANIATASISGPLSVGRISTNALTLSFVTKSADYTVTAQDYTVLVYATSGSIVITLPAANTLTGQILNIKKMDSSGNQVIVSSSSGIDGGAEAPLTTQYENITVQSHNTSWGIL